MSQGTHQNKGGNGDKDNKPPYHDDKYREDLHEPKDWMVYSHAELYNMVHTGVNLEGANAAATNWQKIAEDIANVRQNLFKAVEDSTDGWGGESARLAREGLISVTDWVKDTSTYAQKVSAAITTETSNVEAARAAMPPPPQPPESPAPDPVPTAAALRLREPLYADRLDRLERLDIASADAYTAAERPRLMTTLPANEFSGFNLVGASAVDALAANDASHRRAADVMAAFQRNSAAVDQTVPSQFTPPVNPVNPVLTDSSTRTPGPTPDGGAGGGAGGPVATGAPGPNRSATGATGTSSRGGAGGGYGRGGSGGGMSGFGAGRRFVPNSGGSAGAGGGGASSSGGASGVLGDGRAGAGAGAAAAAASSATGNQTRAFQNPLAMGGAPMAAAPAAAGGARDDEREHKSASYLEEDDNVFGLDRKAAPPVIGQ